jgi:hypothetical protein
MLVLLGGGSMNAKPLVLICFLLGSLPAFAVPRELTHREYQSINQFYADCNYVAQNSSPGEMASMIRMIRRDEKPRFGLLDTERKKIYAAIRSTQDMILKPDPFIFGLMQPVLPYAFKTTPVSVRATGTGHLNILVTREGVLYKGSPFQPVSPDNRVLRSGPHGRPTVITEVDTWARVAGRWMLQEVHHYLI